MSLPIKFFQYNIVTLLSVCLVCTFLFGYFISVHQAHAAYWNYTYITRNGNSLYQNGVLYRFAGANIPWLGYDNAKGGQYPSNYRIEDAISTTKEMGATVIRAHTLGISVGCSACIEPTLNQFNDAAFTSIDYSLKYARDNHIRVIIPLVDNYHYYHGGKHTFTDWEHDSNEDDFYSNPQVIQDFETYISHIVNHVNIYTGTMYKNDPTILAWETGNELDNATTAWDDAWTQTIASYIKSIDIHHLVADGHIGNYSTGRNLTVSQLQLPSVDLYSDHFYPLHTSFMQQDASMAAQFNKAYFVGEYDWTDTNVQSANGTIQPDSSTSTDGTESANITITQVASASSYMVQLVQANLSFTTPHIYTISVDAKADNNSQVQLILQQGQAPWTQYATYQLPLSSNWQTFIFTYTPQVDQPNSLLVFNLAQAPGNIWLDNIKVSPDGTSNLVQNGSFEGIWGNWLSGWQLKVQPPNDILATTLPVIENPLSNISGDLFWQLYGHDDLHGFVSGDGYTLHYPGDNANMQLQAQMLRSHMYTMSQTSIPAKMLPLPPQINQIVYLPNGNAVDWRGTTGASTYIIERSNNGTKWQQIAANLTDYSSPWTDQTASQSSRYSYRVTGINPDGLKGKYSNYEPTIGNLIQNSQFEHTGIFWNLLWNLALSGTASATLTQNLTTTTYPMNNAALITITQSDPVNIWNVQLRQTGISLTANSSYIMTFQTKASSGYTDAKVVVQKSSYPYTVYTYQPFSVSTNWQTASCAFTASISDPTAMLAFNLAKYPGQVWIDNVSVTSSTQSATTSCITQ